MAAPMALRVMVACAVVALSFGHWAVVGQSLSTAPPDDTNGDGAGLYINLTAFNDVEITSFDLYSDANEGESIQLDIYTIAGPYQGSESNSAAWTLLQSFSRITNDRDTADSFVLNTPLSITGGNTTGVYLVGVTGGIQHRDVTGSDTISDANLELFTDVGSTSLFGGAQNIFGNFAGSVNYNVTGVTIEDIPLLSSPSLLFLAALTLVLGSYLLIGRPLP